VVAHPYDRFYLAWSTDSTQLLVVRQTQEHEPGSQLVQVQIWNGMQARLLQDTALIIRQFSQILGVGWGRAGPQMLLTVSRDLHYLPAVPQIWDLQYGRLLAAPNLPGMPLLQATWSPTGRHIVAFGDQAAWVFDSASGAVINVVERPTSLGAQFAWSPDGSQLLLSGQWQGHVSLSHHIIDPDLLLAELTRRVGEWSRNPFRGHESDGLRYEEVVRASIPDWQGEQAELTAVADRLAQYDQLLASPPMY
jgi:WD40 repeat protein